MAILSAEENTLPGKCAMCSGKMERSNIGYICNTCKDTMRKK